MFRTKLTFELNSHRNIDFPPSRETLYNFHRTRVVNIACDKSEDKTKQATRPNTRVRMNRYLADKLNKNIKKKKPRARGAANCSRYFLFSLGPCRFTSVGIGNITDRIYPSNRTYCVGG